jgi:hypothetical protein
MSRTPDSSAFAKGQLMQVVKAGESAQEILENQETSTEDRKELRRAIQQAEMAKECLREMGVNIK